MHRVVIVGGSIGGVRTAQALRTEGFAGDIVILGEERELPYNRPALSKQFLGTDTEPDAFRLLAPADLSSDLWRVRLGARAASLDVDGRAVELEDGERVGYDTLVIATGAAARSLPCQATHGVHTLRTVGDASRLRDDLSCGGSLIVVGAGFVGSEVAATACALGIDVTLVEPSHRPMGRLFDAEVGAWFIDLHERNGIHARFGQGVTDIRDGKDGVLQVSLTGGQVMHADTVLVGIGAVPNDQWLTDSGLVIADGVMCDSYCRALGTERVFAVGDVVRFHDAREGRHVRDEHWTNAVDQASCVARNIIHPDDMQAYLSVPYVWSDQHDWRIQIVGRTHDATECINFGDPSTDHRLAALYGRDGWLAGAVVVNWPRALLACRRALRDGSSLRAVASGLR